MFQDMVLMRALRDMNLPKFVFEDVPLFLGLISDLFPGLDCPRVRYPKFNDAVEEILVKNKYILLAHQVSHVRVPRRHGNVEKSGNLKNCLEIQGKLNAELYRNFVPAAKVKEVHFN